MEIPYLDRLTPNGSYHLFTIPAMELLLHPSLWLSPARLDPTMCYFPIPRNFPICSFKNFSSAGLPPAPAVCPHKDGMGTSETFSMNPASYRASPTGKYRSVSDGI